MKIEESLRIGSRMTQVLAEILMKRWEEEKIEDEGRIMNFRRYVVDSTGIWKGRREDLEEKVKTKEDRKKGIKLVGCGGKGQIAFLDVELKRGRKDEIILTKWFRKKESAGILSTINLTVLICCFPQ